MLCGPFLVVAAVASVGVPVVQGISIVSTQRSAPGAGVDIVAVAVATVSGSSSGSYWSRSSNTGTVS